jgi:hypothetical protein
MGFHALGVGRKLPLKQRICLLIMSNWDSQFKKKCGTATSQKPINVWQALQNWQKLDSFTVKTLAVFIIRSDRTSGHEA